MSDRNKHDLQKVIDELTAEYAKALETYGIYTLSLMEEMGC